MTTIPSTQKAIFYNKQGGPEVLKYGDVPVPAISDTEILIKNKYAGINFIETYFRKGVYPVASFPYIGGREASGVVAQVGSKVKSYSVGDKVAYLSGQTFAQYTKVPETGSILKLRADADEQTVKKFGGSLLSGLTALTFIDEAYTVKEGDYILVTAAAGGLGLLLDQLISGRKAHVIAVASSKEKLARAKANGAEYLLDSSELSDEQILEQIEKITAGKGVNASFDSVGKDTAELSLAAVGRKGTWVSIGNASGKVPPLSINRLSPKNLKVVRPMLFAYIATPQEFGYYSQKLATLIENNQLTYEFHYHPLSEYPEVTVAQESRKTTGKLVLEIPQ